MGGLIYCNECKHEFIPDLQEVAGYQYFKCPACGKEYPVGYITVAGEALRQELNAARRKLNSMIERGFRPKTIQKQQKVIEEILVAYQKEYKRAMV